MIASKRITIVDKEDLQLDLEYNEEYAILHLPKMKMTKAVYTDFLVTVPEITEFIRSVGYEAVYTAVDPKDTVTAKLLDRLGAKNIGHSDNLDVYIYGGEI